MKQLNDESFSSFYVELWVLCDEMTAINDDDKNSENYEMKMVNQFVHGIHDRLVKIDVKKYVANTKEYPTFCAKDVLQAAQYYAEQHEVDINYFKSYKISWNLLNGIKEMKLSVANISLKKRVLIGSRTYKGNLRDDGNDRKRLLCYSCHKP